MSQMNERFIAGTLLVIGVVMLIVMVTKGVIDDSWRYQIQDHGCAEFYLDQNYDRQWHWTK